MSEILPLNVEKETAPPFPALPVLDVEYEEGLELLSDIEPLADKEIAPPFRALPKIDWE
jgi:hypothetical protein